MTAIAGHGLKINLIASITFPAGIILTQFADDSDPFDLPSQQIKDKAMGLNGDILTWSKANPINVTIGIVPKSEDDINLGILFEQNRPGRGKLNVDDIITMVGIYPDGSTINLTNGSITDGMPGDAVASSGRLKSKTYSFSFENVLRA